MIMRVAFGSGGWKTKKSPPEGGPWSLPGRVSWRSLQVVREGRAAASRDRQRHQRAASAAARVIEKERLFMAI
jgi:hypothetical protein